MRRTYISNEFTYFPVNGTLSMKEKGSFFGSKVIKIEDNIDIDNDNIIYYQNTFNEQLDLSTEISNPPVIFSASDDKNSSSQLILDKSQPSSLLNTNTRWILTININDILTNYIFALLKKYRTFNGVQNSMTVYNKVDSSIANYIDSNIINQYKYNKINFYISYNNLQNGSLKYNNTWNSAILSPSNLLNNISTTFDSTGSIMTINFSQLQPSSQYSFNYYFDLFFNRI